MPKQSKSISTIWVDDNISHLEPFVKHLNKSGFAIITADCVEKAIDIVDTGKTFDLIIADLRMQPTDGIECLLSLDNKLPKCGRAVITSFGYLQQYKDRLDALDFEVTRIEKPLPAFTDVGFEERVLSRLKEAAAAGRLAKKKVKKPRDTKPLSTVNPFEVSYEDFLELSIDEKDALTDAAVYEARDVVREAFSKGAVWLLLCGSPDQVRLAVNNHSRIPLEQEILKFAENLKLAPYQVCRNLVPEETWTKTCDKDQGCKLDGYPTITIKVSSKPPITCHFDTGAEVTFFSYEDAVELGGMQPVVSFITAVREGLNQVYRFAQMRMTCRLVCQGDGQMKTVNLTGQAVRNWYGGPFVRRCLFDRPDGNAGTLVDETCKHRMALIGRNILIENALVLVLDGRDRKTKLFNEKKELDLAKKGKTNA